MASPPLAQRGRGGFFHRQPAFVIRQKARETRRIGTVRLLHALRAHGMDVPLDALTVSDCADAVAAALKP